jgi:hypothetical protein
VDGFYVVVVEGGLGGDRGRCEAEGAAGIRDVAARGAERAASRLPAESSMG